MSEFLEAYDSYLDDPPRSAGGVLSPESLRRPIRSLVLRKPICLDAGQPVTSAIDAMRKGRMGSVLVTEGKRLVGILTERDVLHRVAGGEIDCNRVPLSDVMRADPDTLPPDAPMAHALNRMSLGGYRHVPLVNEKGEAVGVVSVRDIVDYLVDHFPDQVLTTPPHAGVKVAQSREGA